ncbi:hypothetical protein LCGC14_2524510, partial [marine sediment metagenome]
SPGPIEKGEKMSGRPPKHPRPRREQLEELKRMMEGEPSHRYHPGQLENFRLRKAIILSISAIVEALDA